MTMIMFVRSVAGCRSNSTSISAVMLNNISGHGGVFEKLEFEVRFVAGTLNAPNPRTVPASPTERHLAQR